jgi:purine-binding chemotaxis protein CheW
MRSDRTLCTLTVDNQLYGVDVLRVQEIIGEQRLTPVPLASPTVVGLLNLRGDIVPAISLRATLGLAAAERGAKCAHVVLRTGNGLASVIVDAIGDVLDADEGRFEEPPDTLSGSARELVSGVLKLDDRLLLELDVDRVLAVDRRAA